jgi:hypothetical protein
MNQRLRVVSENEASVAGGTAIRIGSGSGWQGFRTRIVSLKER